jgi:hypothetical protein
MPRDEKQNLLRRLKKRLCKGRRHEASPAPSATQSTGTLRLGAVPQTFSRLHSPADVRSSVPENTEDESKASSILTTEPCIPPSPSAADAQATRPSTDMRVTGTHQSIAALPTPHLTPPVEPPPKPATTETAEQPTPSLSVSERMWNAAYDSLEADDADLVGSYVKTLEKVLGGKNCEPSAADLSAKLKDPTNRQKHMRELVQKGQEKVSRATTITTRVGDVADFILSAKEMVNLVLQSVPQAAPALLP